MKEIAVYILLILTFLSAAKSHGRQHRLERELRGHWTVSFTSRSQNPPWVNQFWFRQRVVYWSIASITALLLMMARSRAHESGWQLYVLQENRAFTWVLFLIVAVGVSMIVAFVATGLLSAFRLLWALQKAAPPGASWMTGAIRGSILWWLFTATLILIEVFVLRNCRVNRQKNPTLR